MDSKMADFAPTFWEKYIREVGAIGVESGKVG